MVSKYMVLMIRAAALWVHFVEVERAEVSASSDALSRAEHPNPNAVEGPTASPARATDRGNSQNAKVRNMQKRDLSKELTALKTENKKLRTLLKNAVLLLNHKILQHPERLVVKKPPAAGKRKTPRRRG